MTLQKLLITGTCCGWMRAGAPRWNVKDMMDTIPAPGVCHLHLLSFFCWSNLNMLTELQPWWLHHQEGEAIYGALECQSWSQQTVQQTWTTYCQEEGETKCHLSSLICEIYYLSVHWDMASDGGLFGNRRRPVREDKGEESWRTQQGRQKTNAVKWYLRKCHNKAYCSA